MQATKIAFYKRLDEGLPKKPWLVWLPSLFLHVKFWLPKKHHLIWALKILGFSFHYLRHFWLYPQSTWQSERIFYYWHFICELPRCLFYLKIHNTDMQKCCVIALHSVFIQDIWVFDALSLHIMRILWTLGVF